MNAIKYFMKRFLTIFQKNQAVMLSAAQAYFYLLSLFPLLIICFAIIPYMGITAHQAVHFLDNLIPGNIVSIFEKDISSFVETPRSGVLIVGIVGILWTVSNAMNALVTSINKVYDVDETRPFFIVRLLATALTIGMIAALLFAMLFPIFGNFIVDFLNNHLEVNSSFLDVYRSLRWLFGFILLSLYLILLYRYTPNVKLSIPTILPGAFLACILLEVTSLIFSSGVSYFGHFSALYGSLGSVIIIIIWLFFIGFILITGAIVMFCISNIKRE